MKENHEQVVESPFAPASNTLDGRNPAPPNIHETLQIMEALPYQPGWLAGFLNPLNHPTVFFFAAKKNLIHHPKKAPKKPRHSVDRNAPSIDSWSTPHRSPGPSNTPGGNVWPFLRMLASKKREAEAESLVLLSSRKLKRCVFSPNSLLLGFSMLS